MTLARPKKNRAILADIRKKCAYVAGHADYVTINTDKISDYVRELPLDRIVDELGTDIHYIGARDEDTALYVIALDTINFGSGYFDHIKKRPGLSGYMTMAQSLKDRFEDKGALSAADMADITPQECADIFGQDITDSNVAELMQRFAGALNETGQYIMARYNGDVTAFIQGENHSAEKLVSRLSTLRHFHDESTFKGRDIPIYKRAQIMVADLFLAFQGKGLGRFDDIDAITTFADNVVPHVLRMDGVLEYTPELAKKIDNGEQLKQGGQMEVELRACAIHAVALIAEQARKQGFQVNDMNVDHILWGRGKQSDKYRRKPTHRTRTVFY